MLTFDKIREIERAEREGKKLQRLPENFTGDLRDYLKKREQLKSAADVHELENVRNIIRRFFEAREKKILDLALYGVRTGLEPENLTKEEQEFFRFVADRLRNFRESFFSDIYKEKKAAYKVKKEVPAFVGPDMKTYELKENDVIPLDFLPKPLNDLLLKEGVIEEVVE